MNIDWNEQFEAYVDDLLVGLVAGVEVARSSSHLHTLVGLQNASRYVHKAVSSAHHKALVQDGRTADFTAFICVFVPCHVEVSHKRVFLQHKSNLEYSICIEEESVFKPAIKRRILNSRNKT